MKITTEYDKEKETYTVDDALAAEFLGWVNQNALSDVNTLTFMGWMVQRMKGEISKKRKFDAQTQEQVDYVEEMDTSITKSVIK